MSVSNDGKADPGAGKPNTAIKTVVGIPALPSDRPSDAELTRELPPRFPAPAASSSSKLARVSERNVAAGVSDDVRPMTPDDAERILASSTSKPSGGARPRSDVPPRHSAHPLPTRANTLRPSAPPRPATGTGTVPPKAKAVLRPAKTQPLAIEEISSSLLLPDAADPAPARVEELSGSLLVEDPPDGKGAPEVRFVTSSAPPPAPRSSPAPVHGPSLGLPELPKATPAPDLELAMRAQAKLSEGEPSVIIEPTPIVPPAEVPFSEIGPLAPGPFAPPPEVEEAPTIMQPPRAPIAPMTGDIELTQLPRGGIGPMVDALRELTRQVVREIQTTLSPLPGAGNQRPWFLWVVAVTGFTVGVALLIIVVTAARGGSSSTPDHTVASASPPPSATLSVPVATALAPEPPAVPAPASALRAVAACTVAGSTHVVAPTAILGGGLEVARVGDDIAIGFATTDHDAMAVRIDPNSLSASDTAKASSADAVKRATPVANGKGGLSLVLDADRKRDRVQGRRTVLSDPAVQFGASGGHLMWAHVGGAPAGKLWPLEAGGPVDAIRGAAEGGGERTIALAFRRDGGVWMGTAAGQTALASKGELSHVDGLGTAIGSPAVAISDGVVLIAWSDRSSSQDPWRLRWVRFTAGDPPGEPNTFTPPAGGRGAQTMSPGIAAVPGGRFLLVWTEGPPEGHDVRALTLSSEGQPIGGPLAISNPGVNAGEGRAAVTADGHGVVSFLESSASGFQVVATGIMCEN